MVRFQLVIDCADPDRLARFWKEALQYQFAPAPEGYASWDDYYRALGFPEEDLDLGEDRLSDPQGDGPDIWFQKVDDVKTVKNRLHIDIGATGGIGKVVPRLEREARVTAEAERLARLGATIVRVLAEPHDDHYAIAMSDPEGNEFDIN
jgi:Glyoxalase-like domain